MRHKDAELMRRIHDYAEDFYLTDGRSPSTTEIAKEMKIARGTAYKYLAEINRDVLSFPSIHYWRIGRSSFYTDVRVELKLNTVNGPLTWNGWLVFWCSFLDDVGITVGSDGGRDGFECSIEDMTATLDRKADGFTQLDSYLIPFSDNKRTDATAEKIWFDYIPEALHDPKKRNAYDLAKVMGLTVKHQWKLSARYSRYRVQVNHYSTVSRRHQLIICFYIIIISIT